jgi:hypothetical protein
MHQTKRARSDDPDTKPEVVGREQLFLASSELQVRVGKKYCDESELLPLLLAHGLVRRAHTIQVTVRPLGGDSFKITLDATRPLVGEAKAEIARVQGTSRDRQELYKVAVREDGGAVREDDAEPDMLSCDAVELREGEEVTMAVKEQPLVWRTCFDEDVALSEGGSVATSHNRNYTLVTSGIELVADQHFWEVELLSKEMSQTFIGITRPNLEPCRQLFGQQSTGGWLIGCYTGGLRGNGKSSDDRAGGYKQGDRVGLLLNLKNGSLRFFKNGVMHGPGFPAGSVTGPVVHAIQFAAEYRATGVVSSNRSVRLCEVATFPTEQAQRARGAASAPALTRVGAWG